MFYWNNEWDEYGFISTATTIRTFQCLLFSNFQWICLALNKTKFSDHWSATILNCSMLSPKCQIALKLTSKQCIKLLIPSQRCENAFYGHNAFGWVFHLSIKSFQIDFFFSSIFISINGHTPHAVLQLTNVSNKFTDVACPMPIDLAAEKVLSVSSWLIGIAHLEFGHDWRFCHKMHLRSNGFQCLENWFEKRNMNFQNE